HLRSDVTAVRGARRRECSARCRDRRLTAPPGRSRGGRRSRLCSCQSPRRRSLAQTTEGDTMPGPLSDLKVLELAGIGPGPFAALLLADMGADVIRVARPGDPALFGATPDATARGRTHVEADLKDEQGRELVRS